MITLEAEEEAPPPKPWHTPPPRPPETLRDEEVLHALVQAGQPISSFEIGRAVGLASGNPPKRNTSYWHWHGMYAYRAVMAAIRRLEERGLLERVGPSAERTRRHKYQPTHAGLVEAAL